MKEKGSILFANGRMCYPFVVGGDGYLTHELLSRLGGLGYRVLHLAPFQPVDWAVPLKDMVEALESKGIRHTWSWSWYDTGQQAFPSCRTLEYDLGNYQCKMLDPEDFWQELGRLCRDTTLNVVMTQLDAARRVLTTCKEAGVPVILWVLDVDHENETIISTEPLPDAVVFDSLFLQSHYERTCRAKSYVVHPILDFDFSAPALTAHRREYISMVNPTLEKGGEIFLAITREMPEEKFLVLEGWGGVSSREFSLPNLTVLSRHKRLADLYSLTEILLVPSVTDDAFPTVIPMALARGIPVIGSKRGGIPEAVGAGGLIVDEPCRIEEWVGAINKLRRSPGLYADLSSGGQLSVKQYEPTVLVNRVRRIIEEVRRG